MKPLSKTMIYCTLAVAGLAGCSGQETVDLTEAFAGKPEFERLRYFREINMQEARATRGLTGEGVRVTIMGEMVDSTHPELASALNRQFNAFAVPGTVVAGNGAAAYKQSLMQQGDGHGTHIAGTIAAACDDIGVQGIACGASLDVYSLGAYDESERFRDVPGNGSETDSLFDFLAAFRTAITDVTRRNESKIVTGSFNVEAPAVRFTGGHQITRQDLNQFFENTEPDADTLLNSELFTAISEADHTMLGQMTRENGNDFAIPLMALVPSFDEYKLLARAVGEYQRSGGVYIITESNYQFGDETSALNAMPSLSTEVDPDLWLSVVMVTPTGYANVTNDAELDTALEGPYTATLNGCGTMAQEYCIVVPSYDVLSSMTSRVSYAEDPLITLDGREYQLASGHSMGAPMVAAALAILQEYNAKRGLGLSMKSLVRILKDTADRSFGGYDRTKHGQGMLDIDAALARMALL